MSNHQLTQSSTLPPAQPAYVLRGHSAQIHSAVFLRQNLRLLSGDAEGWIVLWNLPIKRPVAVWRAHQAAILGVASWGDGKVITHGRDNKLLVWQLREEDETALSKTLPIEDATSERKQPWLLHSLTVNALNFCSFAFCPSNTSWKDGLDSSRSNETSADDGIIFAVPGLDDGHINLTRLPTEQRITTIPSLKNIHTGLLMTVVLHMCPGDALPTILAGYESGHVCVWQQQRTTTSSTNQNPTPNYQPIYIHHTHSQPVLSLSLAPKSGSFYSSSADALLAKHNFSSSGSPQVLQTRHAGQQSLKIRSDEKVLATAGWDGRARVYSTAASGAKAAEMKELAVLKWHKEGCYTVAFAQVLDAEEDGGGGERAPGVGNDDGGGVLATKRETMTVAERRVATTQKTHWLAAGSKDGKVSLWDVY